MATIHGRPKRKGDEGDVKVGEEPSRFHSPECVKYSPFKVIVLYFDWRVRDIEMRN